MTTPEARERSQMAYQAKREEVRRKREGQKVTVKPIVEIDRPQKVGIWERIKDFFFKKGQ